MGDAVKVSGMQVKEGGQGREEERLAGHRREQEDCAKERASAAEFRDREKWRRAIESEIGRRKG